MVTWHLPPEWAPQQAVLLAWPSQAHIWEPELSLARVQRVHQELIAAIAPRQQVLLLVHDADRVQRQLLAAGLDLAQVTLCPVPTNDIWIRDYGPLTVLDDDGAHHLDFGYNGWGLKFPADQDNQATKRLHEGGWLGVAPRHLQPLILEGGSLDIDAAGTLLTTIECLLSPNRNPHLSRRQLEDELCQRLGAECIVWLEHGWLAGDDTDSHVDVLARFAPGEVILYSSCDDPADEHAAPLAELAAELASKLPDHRLIALPIPPPLHGDDGRRLPASYANFLIINGAVLVPTYGHAASDEQALARIAGAFPQHEVIGIDCRPLIYQHGSLHCATMQLPAPATKDLST